MTRQYAAWERLLAKTIIRGAVVTFYLTYVMSAYKVVAVLASGRQPPIPAVEAVWFVFFGCSTVGLSTWWVPVCLKWLYCAATSEQKVSFDETEDLVREGQMPDKNPQTPKPVATGPFGQATLQDQRMSKINWEVLQCPTANVAAATLDPDSSPWAMRWTQGKYCSYVAIFNGLHAEAYARLFLKALTTPGFGKPDYAQSDKEEPLKSDTHRVVFDFDESTLDALHRFAEEGNFATLGDAVGYALRIAFALRKHADEGYDEVRLNKTGSIIQRILELPPLPPEVCPK